MFLSRISTPWRIAASGLAAALALSLLVAVTPEGRAVAAGFLAQFRSQQLTAIEVTPQSQSEIFKTLTKSLCQLSTNSISCISAERTITASGWPISEDTS